MGHNILREDKTCLNCGHHVAQQFCPNCGQENTDTRKTFYHLFIHFFEDLTHYENAFWKTIKNLILKPATLTKEYLSGKRLSYLAPVRLYIFISIITFFILAVFPNKNDDGIVKINETKAKTDTLAIQPIDTASQRALEYKIQKIKELSASGVLNAKESDTLQKFLKKYAQKDDDDFLEIGYESMEEIDSIQKFAPKDEKLSDFEYWISKKVQAVKDNNSREEIFEKFKESFLHNFPKVLFIYMPLFAFFLWLFHNKKRWYYFDHGIFTLHYFSFLLLMVLFIFISNKIFSWLGVSIIINAVKTIIEFAGSCWMFYYFFPAHHRFYGETRFISALKSILLLVINFFFIIVILLLFIFYTFINIH